VKEVKSHANESDSLAESIAADAQQLGTRSIEKTIDGMNRIESTARRITDAINRLGERAERIGSILTVIEDITDHTALLALNAAILVAQAGKHGRGFAVVAADIRELADRMAVSTKEINALIGSVQIETLDAVGVMREEVNLLEESVRLARDTRDALEKIRERADVSRDMSRSINKAASEQSRGIRQVSDAVENMSGKISMVNWATGESTDGKRHDREVFRTDQGYRVLQ
jgi:methyl-accepting chemotaxis protein